MYISAHKYTIERMPEAYGGFLIDFYPISNEIYYSAEIRKS